MALAQKTDGITELVEQIGSALADIGIFVIEDELTDDQFRNASGHFGDIVYESEVRMGAERPRNYQLPAAIDFHTDHVMAETIAWRCVASEPGGGEMRFLDLQKIADTLDATEQSALARVGVPDNAAWGGGEPIALALPRSGGLRFHFVPWLHCHPYDWEAAAAFGKFEQAFQAAAQADYVEVALSPGQCVFLDNHRIAHGRAAIPPDSPRHLTRLWLGSDGPGRIA